MAAISTQRLNELLQQVLEELAVSRGSWVSMDGTRFTDHSGLLTVEYVDPRPVYPPEPSVADVLEEDVPGLWRPTGSWGATLMRNAGWTGKLTRPDGGNPQPSYTHECYQCGRPLTDRDGRWIDHAGREGCDMALMDDDDWYTYHQPKPFHGEEEDE